jgi:hypothetical protein
MKAPFNSIFLKVTRTPEKGTAIEKLEIDIKNLLPNTLISSPLFDIEDFISPHADDFRTEYLYSEILTNDDLQREFERVAKKFKLPKPSIGKKKRSK